MLTVFLIQVPPTPQLQLTETVRNDVNLKKQTLKLNKVLVVAFNYENAGFVTATPIDKYLHVQWRAGC